RGEFHRQPPEDAVGQEAVHALARDAEPGGHPGGVVGEQLDVVPQREQFTDQVKAVEPALDDDGDAQLWGHGLVGVERARARVGLESRIKACYMVDYTPRAGCRSGSLPEFTPGPGPRP